MEVRWLLTTHLYPYSMLSPHPPQIQADFRSLGRPAPLQPQLASWPSLQPLETLWTTPALATAWAKAASLEAGNKERSEVREETEGRRVRAENGEKKDFPCLITNNYIDKVKI